MTIRKEEKWVDDQGNEYGSREEAQRENAKSLLVDLVKETVEFKEKMTPAQAEKAMVTALWDHHLKYHRALERLAQVGQRTRRRGPARRV